MLPNRSTNPVQPEQTSVFVAKIILGILLTIIIITSLFMAWTYFYQQYSYNEQVKASHSQQFTDDNSHTTIIPKISVEDVSEKEIVE